MICDDMLALRNYIFNVFFPSEIATVQVASSAKHFGLSRSHLRCMTDLSTAWLVEGADIERELDDIGFWSKGHKL